MLAMALLLYTGTGVWAIEGSADNAERLFNSSQIIRSYGDNRYATSIASANDLKEAMNISEFDNIVVASGENYPDALSGSYLAGVKNAQVLLVDSSSEEKIREYIKSNLKSNGKVYILGGTGVISSRFETSLEENFDVDRLWGADRYDTNLEILKEAGVNGQDLLVCSGNGYADSLSASAVN